MNTDRRYTTCFGAIIDAEIETARKAGMPIEHIMVELGMRWGQCFDAIVARARLQESQKCAH
jgi:hypothetical protein